MRIFHKTWEFFRYNIPNLFKNIWIFREEIYHFRPWDYSCNLHIFKKSLEYTANSIEKYGIESEPSKSKKIYAMRRLIFILDALAKDRFFEFAEKILNKKWEEHRNNKESNIKEWTEKERELRIQFLEEACRIIIGQKKYIDLDQQIDVEKNVTKQTIDIESLTPIYTSDSEEFDGTGIFGWWD